MLKLRTPPFITLLLFGGLAMASPADWPAVEHPAASAVVGESLAAVAVDEHGNTYIAGTTLAAERGRPVQGLYVTKVDPSGQNRVYTAHLSGTGAVWVRGIAVDRLGNAYVAGCASASGIIPAVGALQAQAAGGMDAFAARLDAKGNTWSYATYLGGTADDCAEAITVDRDGNAYLTGWTKSADFPVANALQASRVGETDAFVAKLNAQGSALTFSTYAGGGIRTSGHGIAVDDLGAVYVAGETGGRVGAGLVGGTPLSRDGFVLKLAADGQAREYGELLGGSVEGAATAVALGSGGEAFVAGWSESPEGRDVVATRLGANGQPLYRTVVGAWTAKAAPAIAVDASGSAYVTGLTEGSGAQRSPKMVKLLPDGGSQLGSSSLEAVTASETVALAVDKSGMAVLAGMGGTGRAYVGKVKTCSFRLAEALKQVGAAGESGSIGIETSPECGWSAASSASWLEVSPSGAGFSTLQYRVAPNPGGPRGASVTLAGHTLAIVQAAAGDSPLAAGGITGPIRSNAGFAASTIAACDDCSADSVAPMGFTLSFYGNPYSSVWVNNNGNVTFGSSNGTYTPYAIPTVTSVMIAPFWADVDTRGTGSGLTTYGQDTVNGHKAFGANWINVGYYSYGVDKLNSFQIVLIDRADLTPAGATSDYFDIEMNYSSIQWETGSASSSGGVDGLGGHSARVGFTNGSTTTGTYFELPGSGVNGAFLDGGPNSLIANSYNSGVAGRYVYPVRSGSIVCAEGITPAAAAITNAAGTLTVSVTSSNSSCTWSVTGLPSWITVSSPANGNGTGTAPVSLQVATNNGALRQATMVVAGQNYTVTQGGPDLVVTKTHSGTFQPGDTGRTFTITVNDIGGSATQSAVTVTDTLPTGLTATAMSGTGWTCTLSTKTCTRSDVLTALGYFPAITLTVSVASNAPTSVTNTVTVSGGGDVNTSNNTATDVVGIGAADLTVTKAHTGNFTQGDTGDTYTITVKNSGGTATSGTVTAVDTLPTGLTATAISGVGWTCTLSTKTCTRTDALAPNTTYPAITLTVNVASNAPASVTNTATVSGGGETNTSNDTANDPTTIASSSATSQITYIFPNSAIAGGSAFTLTISGTGFLSGAVVKWNGTALTTTFTSSIQLTASVPASLIASVSLGTASVTVTNPGEGPSISSAFTITSGPAVPTVTGVFNTYSIVVATGLFGNKQMFVYGTGFQQGMTISWNGTSLGPVNSIANVVVPLNLNQTPGVVNLTATNPGGAASSPFTFTVPALRTVASISPSTVPAGGSNNVTLTVYGSNFTSGDNVMLWIGVGSLGSNLTTQFIGSTQLQATIPASTLASNATMQVWVMTEPSGGAYGIFSSTNVLPLIVGTGTQPPFFTGEISLGGGWNYLAFPNSTLFGYYTHLSNTWIFHQDMGYECVSPAASGTSEVYLYDLSTTHWWYTSASLFPYLYDFTLRTWLYYFPDTHSGGQRYTTNPRWFSNMTTGAVFSMP